MGRRAVRAPVPAAVAEVRTSPFAATVQPVAPDGTPWPNGSGVFSPSDRTRERVELGRIVRVGTGYRVFRKVGAGYRDLGTVDSHLAALAALPAQAAAGERAVTDPADTRADAAADTRAAKMSRKPVKSARAATKTKTTPKPPPKTKTKRRG